MWSVKSTRPHSSRACVYHLGKFPCVAKKRSPKESQRRGNSRRYSKIRGIISFSYCCMKKVYRFLSSILSSLIIAINSGSDGRSSRGRGHGWVRVPTETRCHTLRFYSLFLSPSFFHLAIADATNPREFDSVCLSAYWQYFIRVIRRLIAVYHLAGEKFALTKRDVSNVDETSNVMNSRRDRASCISDRRYEESTQLCKYYITFSSIERWNCGKISRLWRVNAD